MAALRGSVSAVFSSEFLFISSLVRLFTPSGPLAEPTFKKRCFLSTTLSVVLGSADVTDSSCCAAFLAFARAIAAAMAALRGSVSTVFSSEFLTALSIVLGSIVVVSSPCCAAFLAFARARAAATAAFLSSSGVVFVLVNPEDVLASSEPLATPTFKKPCFLSDVFSVS